MGNKLCREILIPDYLAEVRNAAASAAPGASADGPPVKKFTLLDKVGGKDAVDAAVSIFYAKVRCDPRISEFFDGQDMRSQRNSMVQYLMSAMSNNATPYRGRDMYTVHKNLDITGEQFDAVVEHFTASLQQMRVPPSVVNEAVACLGNVRNQVLGLEDSRGNPIVRPPTILQRMGGREALESVVEVFYGKVLGDAGTSTFFANVPMGAQRDKMVDFLATVLDGRRWKGRSMADVHAPLGVTQDAFNAVIAHLLASLKVMRTPADVTDDVMRVVSAMRRDIVTIGNYLDAGDNEGHAAPKSGR